MTGRDMIGQQCGSYRLVEPLGEGGMGTVFSAEHVHMGRVAAVKILLPEWSDNQVVVNRFFNEARAASMASHPGIVQIFDCGYSESGRAYLVMERLDGAPLSERLAGQGVLSIRQMTAIARQLAGALGAAHDKGVIHRDLKPDNIFLVADDTAPLGERIVVLDFGIAKLASAAHVRTQSGLMLGTPLYMSPEQCVSSEDVDARSDIYSLGCLMFEMVCGQPPFHYPENARVAMAHVEDPPPPPRDLRPDIPVSVEAIILRMLAKRREDRPQTMHDLHAELDVLWGLLPEGDAPRPIQTGPEIPILAISAEPRAPTGGAGRPASGRPASASQDGPAQAARAARPGSRAGVRAATGAGQPGQPRPPRTPASRARAATGSERKSSPPGGNRSRWILAGAVAIAVSAASAALIAHWMGRGARGAGVRDAIVELDAGAALDAAREPPAMVTVHITTTPPGAAVYDLAQGTRAGVTPFQRAYARTDEPLTVRITLPGYRDELLEIARDRDTRRDIALVPTDP